MEECTHDCANCSANCDSRDPKSFIEQPHPLSRVKKVVAVLSGKGGVGKSLVTSLLAVNTQRAGYRAAILDADVTGPSIPQAFGIHDKATGTEDALFSMESKTGIQMMSINLLLPDETSPVVWRGPVIAGAVKQFWTDVVWKDVDVLYVDMPPGTGDVPLTVMQSLPVDGIVVVTSPQELVGMIVEKAVKMAGLLNVPIVGIVENLSYFECPDCGKKHYLFGESHLEEIAKKNDIPETARIPIQPKLSAAVDAGLVELYEGPWLDKLMAGFSMKSSHGIVVEGDASNYAAAYDGTYLLPNIESHTITQPLIDNRYSIFMPLSSGITWIKSTDNVKTFSLLRTTISSYEKEEAYNYSTLEKEAKDPTGPFTLAMLSIKTSPDYSYDDKASSF